MMLKPRLAREGMAPVYERLERPLIPVLAQMEAAGIAVDQSILKRLSADFAVRIADLEAEIHHQAGEPFNVASPKQLGEVLFEKLGLEGGKKSKTGAFSTGADVLEELAANGVEIAKSVLDYRQLAKLKSTYTDALTKSVNSRTGRVHTSFPWSGIHRPAVLVRSESTEYPYPDRRGPPDQNRLCGQAWLQADLG